MDREYPHQTFDAVLRRSQSLSNDCCQNILYKAVFEHFVETKNIGALLLASKSFQNSSFGANFLVNFVVDQDSILLLESVLSPSSCFSLQFVPSLHIQQWMGNSEKINRDISDFVSELVNSKYLRLSLQSLTLRWVTDEGLSLFFGSSSKAWPQLRDLTLEYCGLNASVLEFVAKNGRQLRTASFRNSGGITDAGLEHLSALSNITSLNLPSYSGITDTGLEHLSKLSHITSLNLTWLTKITETGLVNLSELANIRSLNLTGCDQITDAVIEQISELSSLTTVDLSWCNKITDAGLEHLSKLSGITSLNLSWCFNITDAGLNHIFKLPGITSLSIIKCDNITTAAKEKLKMQNCRIIE